MSDSSSSSDGDNPHHCIKHLHAAHKQEHKLKKRIKHSKHEIKELKYEINALTTKTQKIVDEVNGRFTVVKTTAVTKEENVKTLSEKHAAVNGELTFHKSVVEQRGLDYSATQSELTKVETELATTNLELKKLQNEEANVADHEKQLEELAAREAQEIADLQARSAKEQAEVDELTAKTNEEKAKLHAALEELKKLDDELEDLNKQIKNQEIEIEHYGGHVEEIVRKKLPPAHSDLQTHTSLHGSKSDQLTKITTDLGVVLTKIPVEIGEKKDLLKVYDTHTMTISQLKQRVSEIEADIHDLITTKQQIQQSHTQAVEQHKAEQERLEKANTDYNEISLKLKSIRRENDGVYEEVKVIKEKVKALATEEAVSQEAEAELIAREAKEREELDIIRKKEAEERAEIAALKKALLDVKHALGDHELNINKTKQTTEKVFNDWNGINAQIAAIDQEIGKVNTESAQLNGQIAEIGRAIVVVSKAVEGLEFQEASLGHLEGELDAKIRELYSKEAQEHQEFENSEARVVSLRVQLDRVQADIARAQATLGGKAQEHEQRIQSAELDIKSVNVEQGHRSEVHGIREKELRELEALAKKYSATGIKERKDKKKKKKKEKKHHHHHHSHHKKYSSSTSSSSDSSSYSD